MIRKFERMKALQLELGNLTSELNDLKVESHNHNLKIGIVRQDSNDGTDTEPLIAKLQEIKHEIVKAEKRVVTLGEEITNLSEKLLKFTIAEVNTIIDKLFQELRTLEADYDRAWRVYANDEDDVVKAGRVRKLREDKTVLQEKIKTQEGMLRQMEAGSTLSLNKFFKESQEAVVA